VEAFHELAGVDDSERKPQEIEAPFDAFYDAART
jgi:hypothetical protein